MAQEKDFEEFSNTAALTSIEMQETDCNNFPPFGRSLHVDLYGVSQEICDDLSFCYQLLDDLTHFLQMHKQAPPFIFRSPEDQFPEKAGLSGWVPLIESGMSIHTLTLREFVSLDIYTCGDLDVEKTIAFLYERLQAKSHEQHYLVRGVMYHVKG